MCNHCSQSLSNTAFMRHRDLPGLYCPAYKANSESDESAGSDSTFDLSENVSLHETDRDVVEFDVNETSLSDVSSDSHSSSSAPEIWEDESSNSDNSTTEENNLIYLPSVFLMAFRIVYNIADRALLLLLSFFSNLLSLLFSFVENPPTVVKSFLEAFPKSLYSLRKKYVQTATAHIYPSIQSRGRMEM